MNTPESGHMPPKLHRSLCEPQRDPIPRARASKYLCLVLPFPPSTNTIWRSAGGRTLVSAKYRAWKEQAVKALHAQNLEHFSLPVDMTISLGRPDKRRRDLGNYEKAISDALVNYAEPVLMDDSLIHKLTLQWDDKVVGAMVEIEER